MKIILYYAGILLGILILSGFTSQNARGEGSEKQPKPVKKLALLIANQNYPQGEGVRFGRLNTPIKDVRGIANALEEAGFTSFVYENLSSKADLEGAVNYLFQQLKEDDTAWLMFYYAGHATEANGQNYLIPTGVGKLRNQEELEDQAMSVQTGVMEKMRRQGKINIVVLDACRSHSGKTAENAADDFEGGDVLDSVGGENVFVVYSTASDETALDGKRGEYSPFAESLIKGIQQLHWYPLGMMLWWVGEQVQTKTSQQPYLYIPAGKNICLSKCSKPEPIIVTP